jgi:hypothetical protein
VRDSLRPGCLAATLTALGVTVVAAFVVDFYLGWLVLIAAAILAAGLLDPG